jgi:hypothetical protein
MKIASAFRCEIRVVALLPDLAIARGCVPL